MHWENCGASKIMPFVQERSKFGEMSPGTFPVIYLAEGKSPFKPSFASLSGPNVNWMPR